MLVRSYLVQILFNLSILYSELFSEKLDIVHQHYVLSLHFLNLRLKLLLFSDGIVDLSLERFDVI